MNKLLTLLCPIKVGQYANWRSQDILMWEQPKRVVHISRYKWSFFAYFDGSMTGIPVKQLVKE
mgnify:CR=1 FL=1